MPSFHPATVTEVLSDRPGLQRVVVAVADRPGTARAFALTDLVGPVAVGDEVVVNTTAVDLDLGTGGWHVVHWNLSRRSWVQPGGGHIMKLRYTSVQVDVGAAEEQHPDLPADLGGVPVVVCGLHSQVGVVAAVAHHLRPAARLVYVMTDGAALPLALSDLVAELRGRGILAGTVTAGHAFGGDLEAVAVPSALALARHVLAADLVVVGMGPGVVGTGTELGTTSVEVATIADAAVALGGRPVLCVRASDGDERGRHQGTSHHTLTALRLLRSAVGDEVVVPVPPGLPGPPGSVAVAGPEAGPVLDRLGLRVTTMGRGPDADPLFFAAASAAAASAVALLGPA